MHPMLRSLFKTMRPRQWVKNGFVFVPLLFDLKIFERTPFSRAAIAFVLFCLMSSTIYIINDIVDREKDRQHPRKRNRPIASGKLPVNIALAAAALLAAVSLSAAFLLETGFGLILAAYFLLQLVYSLRLKHMVILDVMTISAGFVLRVAGGVAVVHVVRFSPWLYLFTIDLALLLAIGKRRHEMLLLQENANAHRRILDDYSLRLLDEMINLVTVTVVMTYSLYTFSAPNLPANHSMMLTIPFVLYGLLRYLYLIHVKGEGGAPDELFLSDRPLFACVLLWGIAVIAILYFL